MDHSSRVCQRRQRELAENSVKLKVIEDLLTSTAMKIDEKKKTLKVENSELDKLHDKVWALESETCDIIWDFSRKHDFQSIIANYPDVPSNLPFDCDCEVKIRGTVDQDRNETRLLLNEIEELKAELEAKKSYGLIEDIMKFKRELSRAEEGTTEILSLRKQIDECKERIFHLKELNSPKSNCNYGFFNDTSRCSPTSKFKNKCPLMKANDLSDPLHFRKASEFMSDTEKHSSSASCSSAVADNKPRSKFVFKQRSNITQRQMR